MGSPCPHKPPGAGGAAMPAGCSGATRATGAAGQKKKMRGAERRDPPAPAHGGTRGDTWGHMGTRGAHHGTSRTATLPPAHHGPAAPASPPSAPFFFWFPLFFFASLPVSPIFFSFFFTFCLSFYLIFLFNPLTFLTFPPLSPPFKYTFSSLSIHRFSFFPF